jgi:HSP20 family protein
VEIFEADGNVFVRGEVPGMTASDIQVAIADGILTIEGELSERREEQGRNFFVCEREYGKLQRRITLPVEVDARRLEWTVADGLLTISVPLSEPHGTSINEEERNT